MEADGVSDLQAFPVEMRTNVFLAREGRANIWRVHALGSMGDKHLSEERDLPH